MQIAILQLHLVVFQFGIVRIINTIDYLDYNCEQNIKDCKSYIKK